MSQATSLLTLRISTWEKNLWYPLAGWPCLPVFLDELSPSSFWWKDKWNLSLSSNLQLQLSYAQTEFQISWPLVFWEVTELVVVCDSLFMLPVSLCSASIAWSFPLLCGRSHHKLPSVNHHCFPWDVTATMEPPVLKRFDPVSSAVKKYTFFKWESEKETEREQKGEKEKDGGREGGKQGEREWGEKGAIQIPWHTRGDQRTTGDGFLLPSCGFHGVNGGHQS